MKNEVKSVKIIINININQKNLEYLITIKKLVRNLISWAEFLSNFNLIISYIIRKKIKKINLLIFFLNNWFSIHNYND